MMKSNKTPTLTIIQFKIVCKRLSFFYKYIYESIELRSACIDYVKKKSFPNPLTLRESLSKVPLV